MPKVKYRCPVCSDPVLTERWEMGYNYCTKPECKTRLGVSVNIYETPPAPGATDLSPWELDDLAAEYNEDYES